MNLTVILTNVVQENLQHNQLFTITSTTMTIHRAHHIQTIVSKITIDKILKH